MDTRYEYTVEPVSLSPDELENERHTFEDPLNEAASEGWVLDETIRVDRSSFLLVFRRPASSPDGSS